MRTTSRRPRALAHTVSRWLAVGAIMLFTSLVTAQSASAQATPEGTVITNQATGVISAADADAIRPGTNATIVNLGKIVAGTPVTSVGNATGNDAIDYKTHTGVVISNGDAGHTSASITGARHGITGSTPSTITNYGVITGKDGSGINLDTSSTTTATITNYGTIIGNAVSADGDGVDVDGLAAINNSGTISGAPARCPGTCPSPSSPTSTR